MSISEKIKNEIVPQFRITVHLFMKNHLAVVTSTVRLPFISAVKRNHLSATSFRLSILLFLKTLMD